MTLQKMSAELACLVRPQSHTTCVCLKDFGWAGGAWVTWPTYVAAWVISVSHLHIFPCEFWLWAKTWLHSFTPTIQSRKSFLPPPRKWCIKTIRVTPFWGRPQTDHNIPNLLPIIFPLIFVFCCGTCQVHGMSRANKNAPHCLSKQLFLVFCLLGPIQKRWFKMKTLPTVQLYLQHF